MVCVKGPFFCRENVKWIIFTCECVKQEAFVNVNVKLENFVREFVNSNLWVDVNEIETMKLLGSTIISFVGDNNRENKYLYELNDMGRSRKVFHIYFIDICKLL